MINSVRNTVLAVLNKNNFGYLTPQDFNLFAKQAQLDIFEELYSEYNFFLKVKNRDRGASGYADMLKEIKEQIDYFSTTATLVQVSNNTFTVPSDLYRFDKVLRNDATATYINRELEPVTHAKITMLLNSNLTPPTEDFGAYTLQGDVLTAYPTTLDQANDVVGVYIRLPLDPKWTFSTLTNGEAVFDQSQGDYQDFELSIHYEPKLVRKILEYAGVTIREEDVRRFADVEQQQDIQENV